MSEEAVDRLLRGLGADRLASEAIDRLFRRGVAITEVTADGVRVLEPEDVFDVSPPSPRTEG